MAINITLPDVYYQRLQNLAQKSGKDIEDVLTALPTLLLPSLDEFEPSDVTELSDKDVIGLANSRMNLSLNARFSALQYKQQAEGLNEAEKVELILLLTVSQTGQLRKAQAMVEAQDRGLEEDLEIK